MARIQHLIEKNTNQPGWVIYWMQQSHRIQYNHALKLAIELANQRHSLLLVIFGLTRDYPMANKRHYHFMTQNLEKMRQQFFALNIRFVVLPMSPDSAAISLLPRCSALVMDVGYTRIQREWRKKVYEEIISNHPHVDLYSAESDVIVPVRDLSNKEEYAARTIRTKCWKSLNTQDLLFSMPAYELSRISELFPDEIEDSIHYVDTYGYQVDVPISGRFVGGEDCGEGILNEFITNHLSHYTDSSDPSSLTSQLSPYLHFGMISPLYVFQRITSSAAPKEQKDAVLEQLFVRRELAINFIYYHPNYDDFDSILEPWARNTLQKHLTDRRPVRYTREDYLSYSTHDIYFNAAMKEMVISGFMHNYMRMYWAKKIIEWSATPKEAYDTISYLNDTYFLDGRDANSYAGIAWCFGKHDRPWQEREIFGSIRYMNQAGLERKFEMRKYCERVDFLSKPDTW